MAPDETRPEESDESDPTELSLGDVVACARDIVLYAPLALVLDAPQLLPKLAEQGKQHVRNAQALGPHAWRRIQNRLVSTAETVGGQAGEVLRQFGLVPSPPSTGPAPAAGRTGSTDRAPGTSDRAGTDTGTRNGNGASGEGAGSGLRRSSALDPTGNQDDGDDGAAAPASPPVDTLAIPDYDSLSALQVVDRLPGLTAPELEAVRAYESAHRGRKTILNKAAQLHT
jgi:hypothetical protein